MQADLDHIREIEALTRGGVAGELGRLGGLGRDPKVVESWRRCLEKHRIDPAARAEAYIVPDRQLRAHRERSEDLIAIARSGIDSLYKLVAGQDYVLLLSDAEGVSVEYLGDAAQKEVLRQSGLFLGAEWSEERAGTCAVGTCIETGEALIIHQSDHFDVTHGGLSCTAAPIYNSRGALAAVLDISLLSSPRPRESQHLALNLVLQTTRRIEMANLMAENPREWVLRLAGNPAFLDVDPEAALSLDAGGAVIGMTHSAARLMARTLGTDWRAADQLIGRHLSEVFEVDFDALEGLTRGVAARERVEAAASRVKVARAGFFPSINLRALIGLQALGLGNLVDSGSLFGSVGPAISLPIFQGGALKAQLSGRSQGNTFRSESVRLAAPAPWMALGFHVGLSGHADRPLSRWDESFIPMRLRDALREVKRADGRPLVLAEETLLPHRLVPPPAEAPRLRTQAFLAGLALAVLVLVAGKRAPRVLAGGALVFWLVAGLAGLVMAFIWTATSHVAGHGNENLLLLSPLCLFLLPGAWARLRGRAPSKRFRLLLWIVAGSAALAGFLKFLPFLPQENVEWVLLLLPLHWALLRTMDPKQGDEAQ